MLPVKVAVAAREVSIPIASAKIPTIAVVTNFFVMVFIVLRVLKNNDYGDYLKITAIFSYSFLSL
jgi:hypothetical protein